MQETDPLRVLYSFPHRVGAPGIGTTAVNQVRALAGEGARVTLICTSVEAELPADVRVHETLRVLGRRVPHRVLGSPDRALAYHDHRAAAMLRRAGGAFDVVHTWPQSALGTLAAARAVGVLGAREVPNTHTANAYAQAEEEARVVGVPIAADNSHRSDARHLDLEEREYAAADVLLVPSAHVRRTFLERGVPEQRLWRHQYGYDTTRFSADGRDDTAGRPFTAVFVGRAEPRKGLHYALDAWQAARLGDDARLLVAGSFVPGYREHLGSRLEQPGVEVLGFVDDVPALLRRSDVLLLPSVEEGSALVTYEAQASGCVPLVSAAAGALLPADLETRLVHPPRDVAALTRQLRAVADPSARAGLRDAVVAGAAGLTWQRAGQRMIEVFREAISRRG